MPGPIRGFLLAAVALCALTLPASAAQPPAAAIQFTRFASAAAFNGGTFDATALDGDQLALAPGALSGTWSTASVQPQASFTRLVASWNADTPGASRITVQARVTTTGWRDEHLVHARRLGGWRSRRARTSVNGQSDALGRVATDTLYSRGDAFASYVLRVRLERAATDDPSPSVRALAAVVSDYTYSASQPTSTPVSSDAVELAVPPLSQEIHARQYPQWGGGGEAWCSPTSTEMVVEFWGRGPSADDLAWVDPSYADPSVDFAARSTYDAAYRGTGNWPFNTAYAARFGLDAFVTQLRSLAEAEAFVRAGIPARDLDRQSRPASSTASCFRAAPTATWWSSSASTPRATRSSTTRPRSDASGAARLRSRPVRAGLAARLGWHRVHHPPVERGAAARAGGRHAKLVSAAAPRQLLAVDLGLRTGLAAFGDDGRLRWYRSQHFGSTASLRRGGAGAARRRLAPGRRRRRQPGAGVGGRGRSRAASRCAGSAPKPGAARSSTRASNAPAKWPSAPRTSWRGG